MRKADPLGAYVSLEVKLEGLEVLYDHLVGNLDDEPLSESHLAEVTMLAAVVQWDEFISRLFVALVNRDSRRFNAYLRSRVKSYVRDKFGDDVADWVTVILPKRPSKKLTERLLDRKGFVPALNADELQERAGELFIDHVARRFDLSPSEAASIEAWRALRDFVAHRSAASLASLHTALASNNLPAPMRRTGTKKLRSAGAFLRATPRGADESRLFHCLHEMERLGRRFCGF